MVHVQINISIDSQSTNYPLLFEHVSAGNISKNTSGTLSKNASLVYNPALNRLSLLSSGTFVGKFEGNITGTADNATYAVNLSGTVNITSINNTNTNYPILFAVLLVIRLLIIAQFSLNPGSSTFYLAGVNLIGTTNTLTVNGTCVATNFVSTSDIKLKENIKHIESSMDKIINLNGTIILKPIVKKRRKRV